MTLGDYIKKTASINKESVGGWNPTEPLWENLKKGLKGIKKGFVRGRPGGAGAAGVGTSLKKIDEKYIGVGQAAKDIKTLGKIKGVADKYGPWLGLAGVGALGYMALKDKKKEDEEEEKYRYASVKPSEVLEKIGANPDLVDVAQSLEDLSEASSRQTLLGFWDRLGRAAMSAQIYAQPEIQRQMMLERGAGGAVLGGTLGALVGGGLGMATDHGGMRGALEGAAAGTIAGGGLGAYLARRKSMEARRLLENPAAKKALVEKLYRSGGAATQLV